MRFIRNYYFLLQTEKNKGIYIKKFQYSLHMFRLVNHYNKDINLNNKMKYEIV